MPAPIYNDNMKKIRSTSLTKLQMLIKELPNTEASPAVLEQVSKRLECLLDMYLGTLPKSYRGE